MYILELFGGDTKGDRVYSVLMCQVWWACGIFNISTTGVSYYCFLFIRGMTNLEKGNTIGLPYA
jgi:hypothetical protein